MNNRALVTGGSGIIGRCVVERLVENGWYVRVLSRKRGGFIDGVEIVTGDITDPVTLEHAVDGVAAIFHCAGEKHDEERMMDVNVDGTANVVAAAKKSGIQYFCHMSSVSVYGVNHTGRIDENSQTNPITTYSKSKLESEKIVLSNIPCRNTCLLRVGNVVNHLDFGVLSPVIDNGFHSFMRISILGSRGTHMVHAEDVASAALFFVDKPLDAPGVFNVTYDGNESTTLLAAYDIWKSILRAERSSYARLFLVSVNKIFSLLFRLRFLGKVLPVSASFCTDLLRQNGFSFPLGFYGALDTINRRLQG